MYLLIFPRNHSVKTDCPDCQSQAPTRQKQQATGSANKQLVSKNEVARKNEN